MQWNGVDGQLQRIRIVRDAVSLRPERPYIDPIREWTYELSTCG
jgi:hypothetical protein